MCRRFTAVYYESACTVRYDILSTLFHRALAAGVVDGAFARQQYFGDRHDIVAFGQQIVEDIGQSLRCVLARVVEKHDGTALYLACHTLCDLAR